MKRVKITTSNAELEEFLARTDIEIINVDVRSCEQSWFAQEYFTAVIYYDNEPKSEYNPDYWTRLEHQYAGMAMQAMVSNSHNTDYHKDWSDGYGKWRKYNNKELAEMAVYYATALVEKLKEKEERK